MPLYQPLIPTGTVNLDVDYQNLQGNFEQANIVYGTDHYPLDNAVVGQQGFHKKVTMPVITDPVTTAAQGIAYTKDSATLPGRTDLYYAYQTDVGTAMSGTFFPLNICKAFGKATAAGNLIANTSFNVTSADLAASKWTVILTSPIVAAGQEDRIMVLTTAQAATAVVQSPNYNVVDPSTIEIFRTNSGIAGISFWIMAI